MTRFRTSWEAYNWIRWDPVFNPAEFVVLYDNRDEGLAEIAFRSFDPGEIPWHRIRALRHTDGEIVWCRRRLINVEVTCFGQYHNVREGTAGISPNDISLPVLFSHSFYLRNESGCPEQESIPLLVRDFVIFHNRQEPGYVN